MLWLRKSKKGFTLIELMVVVAIIGILALLGLRMYTTQQNKAKNAIVKANTATVHTIIQGNLADTDYSSTDGIGNNTTQVGSKAAVVDIRNEFGEYLSGGTYGIGAGVNSERPAGMQNPHLTGSDKLVVTYVTMVANAVALAATAPGNYTAADNAGVVVVAKDSAIDNKFYIMGLNDNAEQLGEVYIATK